MQHYSMPINQWVQLSLKPNTYLQLSLFFLFGNENHAPSYNTYDISVAIYSMLYNIITV